MVADDDQVAYAKSRLHRAPAVARDVQGDEQIAGEQRARDRLRASRVTAGAQVARQISYETLPAQIKIGPSLTLSLCMHDIPTHAHHLSLPSAGALVAAGTRNKAGA